ncbi:hypothetical protein QJS10_CPA03g01878 [Acorus calamus]|uniref:Syntaxin-5 N-terminal Sly1p-binding domain-containing protein n=1 Tax=Acorus calamus TaxID=4465 RepID=A0AAV9F9L5_ACOCL|nr:hypothetical protein QJS10_CPA03g01878 [Acorus calamus]
MASVSSYRDRTAEFRSVSERLKRSVGGGPAAEYGAVDGGGTGTSPATDAAVAAVAARSEFNKKASRSVWGSIRSPRRSDVSPNNM